jgi:hypothetical protein
MLEENGFPNRGPRLRLRVPLLWLKVPQCEWDAVCHSEDFVAGDSRKRTRSRVKRVLEHIAGFG